MKFRYLLLVMIVASLTSCAGVYYISDHKQDIPKKTYTSYMTEDHCDEAINPIMQQRIKNAVDIKMRSLGYSPSERGDLLVQYFVKNTTKEYLQKCENDYDRWTGGETCREMVITYEEGSIIVDMIDTDNNTIIWHGAARGPSFNAMGKPDQDINRMVGKLLDYFHTGVTSIK